MTTNKITECPKNKRISPNGKKCKKCEFYNPRKWYCKGKEVEVFCTYSMTETEKKFLK